MTIRSITAFKNLSRSTKIWAFLTKKDDLLNTKVKTNLNKVMVFDGLQYVSQSALEDVRNHIKHSGSTILNTSLPYSMVSVNFKHAVVQLLLKKTLTFTGLC